jgi:hypothetical protein
LVAKWSQPTPAPNLQDLRNYLQQPLAENEKIPITQSTFDFLTRDTSFIDHPTSALSAEQLEILFRVSTEERAKVVEVPFVSAIESTPPVSGTEDLFHSTWDANISGILRLILPDAEPIRNSNRNTSTALKRPDYGFLIKNHCIVRGEEKGSESSGDPERELVDKLVWTYHPLPCILGLLWISLSFKAFLCMCYRISCNYNARPLCCNYSATLDN